MNIDIELLPANLRDIAENEQLGITVAMKLVDSYGGTRVWIPADVEHSHHLCRAIGFEKAQQLCLVYALEYLSIEKADKALKLIRDKAIQNLLRSGATVVQAARKYELTERQVYNIKRNAEAAGMAANQSEMW